MKIQSKRNSFLKQNGRSLIQNILLLMASIQVWKIHCETKDCVQKEVVNTCSQLDKQTNVIAELFIALFGQKFFFTSKCRKLRKSTLVNFFLVCFNINYLLFLSTLRVMSYVFYFVDNYFDVCLSGTTTTVQRYRSSSSLC